MSVLDLGSLASAVVGGLLTAGGAWFQQHRNERNQRRKLQMALAMEVASLVTLIRSNGYLDVIKCTSAALRNPDVEAPPFPVVNASHRYFSVFEANAAEVGALEGVLPALIVGFYQGARSLLDTLHKDEAPTWRNHDRVIRADLCDQIAERIENLCVVGDTILAAFKEQGADPDMGAAMRMMLGAPPEQ